MSGWENPSEYKGLNGKNVRFILQVVPGPSVLLKNPPKGRNADTPDPEGMEEGQDYDEKIVSTVNGLQFLNTFLFLFLQGISLGATKAKKLP